MIALKLPRIWDFPWKVSTPKPWKTLRNGAVNLRMNLAFRYCSRHFSTTGDLTHGYLTPGPPNLHHLKSLNDFKLLSLSSLWVQNETLFAVELQPAKEAPL